MERNAVHVRTGFAAAGLCCPGAPACGARLGGGGAGCGRGVQVRGGGRPPVLLPGGEAPLPAARRYGAGPARGAGAGDLRLRPRYADSLRRGYVCARGGVRVGVCGQAVTSGGGNPRREAPLLRVPAHPAGSEGLRRGPPGGGRALSLHAAGLPAGGRQDDAPAGHGAPFIRRRAARRPGGRAQRGGRAVGGGSPVRGGGAHGRAVRRAEARRPCCCCGHEPAGARHGRITAPEDIPPARSLRTAGCGCWPPRTARDSGTCGHGRSTGTCWRWICSAGPSSSGAAARTGNTGRNGCDEAAGRPAAGVGLRRAGPREEPRTAPPRPESWRPAGHPGAHALKIAGSSRLRSWRRSLARAPEPARPLFLSLRRTALLGERPFQSSGPARGSLPRGTAAARGGGGGPCAPRPQLGGGAAEQEKAIECAFARLELCLQSARAEAESRCRLYTGLGIAAGLLLSVVLL